MPDRDRWIEQDDACLLAECDVDAYRASGPGGQKRNKTSSAVRLRHGPSGLIVIGEESRSQHENKARAVKRLRMLIALQARVPVGEGWSPPEVYRRHLTEAGRIEISRRNRDYPGVVAIVLDALAGCQGSVRDAATLLGLSTGQLSKFMVSDGKVLASANAIRIEFGLNALRP